MSGDVGQSADIAGNPANSVYPPGAPPRPVEERLSDLVALLAKGSAEFSLALEAMSQAGKLSPSIRAALNSIKSYAQAIGEEVDLVASGVGAAVPQGALPRRTGDHDEDASSARGRRRNNKAFDFLLLEALHVRTRLSVPVGLGDLKRIARIFDPYVKEASLVAKLNRWKNDGNFLEWKTHEDMHLTNLGIERRTELLPLARKTGQLEDVNQAILAVLGVRSSY